MCEQENVNVQASCRGTITEEGCKINWESTTAGGHPAVKLKFVQSGKETRYKIEPEPEKSTSDYYKKLVQAAAHKAGLKDPNMAFPAQILNVAVSGKSYSLHKA